LPLPVSGEVDAFTTRRVRDLSLFSDASDVWRTGQPRHTEVPHPDPLPTTGEGIEREKEIENKTRPRKSEQPNDLLISSLKVLTGAKRRILLCVDHPGSAKPRVGFASGSFSLFPRTAR
jgi:hypothetical protein